MPAPYAPTSVLVLRMWAESPAPDGLRAEVTTVVDVLRPRPRRWHVAGEEGILEAVAEWVAAYVAEMTPAGGGGDAPVTEA